MGQSNNLWVLGEFVVPCHEVMDTSFPFKMEVLITVGGTGAHQIGDVDALMLHGLCVPIHKDQIFFVYRSRGGGRLFWCLTLDTKPWLFMFNCFLRNMNTVKMVPFRTVIALDIWLVIIWQSTQYIGTFNVLAVLWKGTLLFVVSSRPSTWRNCETLPHCKCTDWEKHCLHCKHFLAVFSNFKGWGFDKLPAHYRESPFLTLD